MTNIVWSAEVTAIGADSTDMLEGGVIILFGEPVPSELADYSIVHRSATALTRDVAEGDTFALGQQTFRIDEVGSRANDNLSELGHFVLYVNQPDQPLLPGAVKATGDHPVAPPVGSRVTITGA
ncbi:PTS glucitol/sorbitol transporter subunit IIA [Acidipropionibacterium timonense]|uniref:PTS glucitol/sorbitol transporter subunit IIA n=1 Tax=Acidipropionibacterium timonense TaxID=2161818 RepID=UPI001031C032|nr:PTS glucitol/sorbitol transporter subunit IIA [Acidipropionibacterium timonense]